MTHCLLRPLTSKPALWAHLGNWVAVAKGGSKWAPKCNSKLKIGRKLKFKIQFFGFDDISCTYSGVGEFIGWSVTNDQWSLTDSGKQFFIPRELKNRANRWLITLPWVHYYPAEPMPQRPRHWNISRGISIAQASASIKKHSHIPGKPLNGFRMGFFTKILTLLMSLDSHRALLVDHAWDNIYFLKGVSM